MVLDESGVPPVRTIERPPTVPIGVVTASAIRRG